MRPWSRISGSLVPRATRERQETFWILVLVDEEDPRRAAAPSFFEGRGGGRPGTRIIDPGNVGAYEPSRGTGRPAWPEAADPPSGLAYARAYYGATYLRSPCSCVIFECRQTGGAVCYHVATRTPGTRRIQEDIQLFRIALGW